jgi:hypothetical protein
VEAVVTTATLSQLAVGSRLIVRSKQNWRFACISRIVEQQIVITVCSPKGGTYRLRRGIDAAVTMHGGIPVLLHEIEDDWRTNFARYDTRW